MKHLTRWLILLFTFCLASPIYAQEANPFGIVEGMWFPNLTCGLNVGWERLIFDWAAHQPTGPDDWAGFLNIPDDWLYAANDCNREVVAVIKNTPAWATDGTPGPGVPRGLDLPIDDPDNVWANFMQHIGSYYASRGVQRFIIWNEPDIQPGTYGFEFEGTLEDYFLLVRVAHLAVKQGNPAARIHLAGTTFWHDANSGERLYTDRLLERIRQDQDAPAHDYYFDAISLHIYFRADTVYDLTQTYRELLDKHGFTNKAIWITETNASPNLDPNWPVTRPQFQITLEQQAAYIVQAMALGLAAGVERMAVYKLFDQQLPQGAESFGLLNPADQQPRPAFYSYRVAIEMFSGVKTAKLARTDSVNVVSMKHTNGRTTLLAWARTADAVVLDISGLSKKVYQLDQYGNRQIVQNVNGIVSLKLPGASCEDEEGCVIGGDVSILILQETDIVVTQIQNGEQTSLEFR